MANEKFTQLPQVSSAILTDVICAVQGGVSVQETLAQVAQLGLSFTVLSFPGDPNSHLAGTRYQFCWDTANNALYICTVTGIASLAVWTKIADSSASVIPPSQGGTGVASPTAHTIPVAEGSSDFTFLGPLTNGQLIIGKTGNDPAVTTLTAGAGVNIINGSGTITLSATGTGSIAWSEETSTSATLGDNTGTVANNGSLVVLTLPASSSLGDEIAVIGKGGGGWKIAQGTGQQINIGNSATTIGVSGFIASTGQYDSIVLICTEANTVWTTLGGPEGIITVA